MKHIAALFFAVSYVLCGLAFAADTPARPNVIVILADDMGWADLGVQGVVRDVKTPHLDALAAAGVRCTAGYITAPQCSPSRAAIITGRYQQRFGIDTIPDVPLPREAITLAERLGPAGYRCGFVGKWHLEPNVTCTKWLAKELPLVAQKPRNQRRIPLEKILPFSPAAQGFHEYFWGEMRQYRANYGLDGQNLKPEGELVSLPDDYRLETQTRAAVAFIERNHARPFYLHVGYYGPHTPLEATKKYLDRFPGAMPERRRYALAMLAAIDDGVGEIMSRLRARGLEEKTLIIFTSDNGAPLKMTRPDTPVTGDPGGWDGSLNDPWIGEKRMLSEGGIRVPFLLAWKGTLPAGKTYTEPVISLDFSATANVLAGLPDDVQLDGVNLIPYLTGEKIGRPHDALYWRFWNQAAIREGRWKYLNAVGIGEFLFDLDSDTHEQRNLIADHRERAAALRARLQKWTEELQPPGIPIAPANAQEGPWYQHYFNTPARPGEVKGARQ